VAVMTGMRFLILAMEQAEISLSRETDRSGRRESNPHD
jgi:hypothetical protein